MMNFFRRSVFVVATVACCAASPALATEWFVAPGGTGDGTLDAPFGRVQDGVNVAQAGDTVTILPGTYTAGFQTVRAGTASDRIQIRAQGPRGSAIVTVAGRVVRVDHAYITVEGLVLDGQYGAADTVDVNSGAHFLILRNLEVRRSSKDLIDIGSPQGMVIEGCLIHHALNAANGRTDAHGVVASAVQNFTIRDTEIHTFSGDGFQVDPGRLSPGWNNVIVERARIWLEPLPAAANGFAAGTVPGENAIDTKASNSLPRATITVRDTTAWGFRQGLISNMAAFNLKENVNATVDGVTVYDSEIAFRLRGPGASTVGGAWVTIKNAVVHDVAYGFRYEDDIANLKIWNSTVGGGVSRPFRAASSGAGGLEVRNLLVYGPLSPEAAHPSNWSVGAEAFVNAAANNYTLAAGSPAIDSGIALTGVTTDRIGTTRPQGRAYDVGAYESVPVTGNGSEMVLYASNAPVVSGNWRVAADPTAAGGAAMWHPDAGASRTGPSATPAHYFDVIAHVESARDYRIWMRGRADNDRRDNDSVWVQFSAAVSPKGKPIYGIGTTTATPITVADCSTCHPSGWGWQDNGIGATPGLLGVPIRFATTGLQTIRVQTREDGIAIDQIVLSPSLYLSAAPGQATNDATILLATQ